MSRRKEIIAAVEELIKDQKDSDFQVSLDMDLRKELEIDSVDLMECIIYLEETYHIDIPDKDIDAMVTVGDMVDYVDKKASKQCSVFTLKKNI